MRQAIFDRTQRLIGQAGLDRLKDARVIVFGVGGVGSFVAEGLVRSGLGALTIVDNDLIEVSNINRQIMADTKTLGQQKALALEKRLLTINPEAVIKPLLAYYKPDNRDDFDLANYDYVVDAIDMVTAKIDLAVTCQEKEIPLISCMGTGNKIDPGKFQIVDIYQTATCPLAKVMRKELKKRGVKALKVLYSSEAPLTRVAPPGTMAFVPSVAGLMIAGQVVRDLLIDKAEGEN